MPSDALRPTVSVINPVRDEEARVADSIERARQLGDVEVIVADGGSSDRTLELAMTTDRVLNTERPLAMIFRTLTALLLNMLALECHSLLANDAPAMTAIPKFQTQTVEGWTVHVAGPLLAENQAETERALGLLKTQLEEIVRVVPAGAVAKLKVVPLWFSPEYAGIRPGAEYHPGRQWLVDHGRNPEMVQGVEFTNIRIFEAEVDRMPNFVLHELAHAYHDRVLSYENPEVVKAFDRAKENHTYDDVERWNGSKSATPKTREKAYAMSNPMEYFAESSEAYFGRNDFYPYNRQELVTHDAEMAELLAKVWGVEPVAAANVNDDAHRESREYQVTPRTR